MGVNWKSRNAWPDTTSVYDRRTDDVSVSEAERVGI